MKGQLELTSGKKEMPTLRLVKELRDSVDPSEREYTPTDEQIELFIKENSKTLIWLVEDSDYRMEYILNKVLSEAKEYAERVARQNKRDMDLFVQDMLDGRRRELMKRPNEDYISFNRRRTEYLNEYDRIRKEKHERELEILRLEREIALKHQEDQRRPFVGVQQLNDHLFKVVMLHRVNWTEEREITKQLVIVRKIRYAFTLKRAERIAVAILWRYCMRFEKKEFNKKRAQEVQFMLKRGEAG